MGFDIFMRIFKTSLHLRQTHTMKNLIVNVENALQIELIVNFEVLWPNHHFFGKLTFQFHFLMKSI